MDYTETIDFLYSQLPVFQRIGGAAYKEGLDNSLYLDAVLNHPHHQYKTIHVGGTNGKGSVSNMLSAVLQSAGYKTGLYTSPHLVDFRERIRVDGKKIEKNFVVDFVQRMQPAIEEISPSFFELTMMMAFEYFAYQQVDIAIIEVGLGGRLDSTNIITPILSVITNISFDHTQFLGNTLPKIAAEKAGIIKPKIPVVIGENVNEEIKSVFTNKAQEMNSPILFAEDNPLVESMEIIPTREILFQTKEYADLTLNLSGLYQKKNLNTVLAAIHTLKSIQCEISKEAVYNGLSQVQSLTGLLGRWQVLQESPKIICDTGHNEAGIADVVEQLKCESYKQLRIVFGMVNDKNISTVLSLLPKDAVYYFAKASVMRALDANELKQMAEEKGLKGKAFSIVEEAISAAKKDANDADLIFVGGSNFVVADALLI